jgi:hypothetical protein
VPRRPPRHQPCALDHSERPCGGWGAIPHCSVHRPHSGLQCIDSNCGTMRRLMCCCIWDPFCDL